MHNFRELKIWQRSMDFAVSMYRLVADFPSDEKYGIVSQIRRCAVSVPSNISEGAGRATNRQFRHFLEIAMGSLNELQSQTEIAYRLLYLKKEVFESVMDESTRLQKMIRVFYNFLQPEST